MPLGQKIPLTEEDAQRGFMEDAWAAFVSWAFDQDWIRRDFEAATGCFMPKQARSGLEAAIDQACGLDSGETYRHYAHEFMIWVTVNHWGIEEGPAKLRELLKERIRTPREGSVR